MCMLMATLSEKSRKFLSGESTVSQSILFVKIRQTRADHTRAAVRGNKPLSKAARRNRAKANNMNRNFAIFLAALGILIVFCSINYLKLKTECTSKRSQLATLESQLAELKEDNDAYESQVTSSVDLERIRKIAIGRLGMKYPSNQQTETYATEGGSYVRQYQDVTGK